MSIHFENENFRVESRFFTGWLVTYKPDGGQARPSTDQSKTILLAYRALRKAGFRRGTAPHAHDKLYELFALSVTFPENPNSRIFSEANLDQLIEIVFDFELSARQVIAARQRNVIWAGSGFQVLADPASDGFLIDVIGQNSTFPASAAATAKAKELLLALDRCGTTDRGYLTFAKGYALHRMIGATLYPDTLPTQLFLEDSTESFLEITRSAYHAGMN